jgi:type II secretory pathway component PulK
LDESGVESLISEREESPFVDVASFIDGLKKLLNEDEALNLASLEPLIAVSSQYFLLETTVRMDNVDQTLFSLMHKDQRGVNVISRKLGIF